MPEASKLVSYAQPFDTSEEAPIKSITSDGSISIMDISFEDLFVDTQTADDSFTGASLPSFHSLFAAYLEAHEALTVIRSGLYELPISDLKDDRGAMGSVAKISELGTRVANSDSWTIPPFPGSNEHCCLQLAFLAAVKGCELAEQISIMVLPPTRTPSYSSFMEFSMVNSPYNNNPVSSPIDDYSWITGPSVPSNHSKLSGEHIAALVRLDVQLSQLNRFMYRFIQSTPEQMPVANVLAARCRRRLSYLHTQIRGVVDSMIPIWD